MTQNDHLLNLVLVKYHQQLVFRDSGTAAVSEMLISQQTIGCLCVSRVPVCTTWTTEGRVCPAACSPPAVGAATPTAWWTAATGRTWRWRRRTSWAAGASLTPHTGTPTLEGRSTVSTRWFTSTSQQHPSNVVSVTSLWSRLVSPLLDGLPGHFRTNCVPLVIMWPFMCQHQRVKMSTCPFVYDQLPQN